MHHDGLRADGFLIPDPFIDLLRRKDPAGISHEKSQNLKFQRCQRHRISVHAHLHGILVKFKSPNYIEMLLRLFRSAARRQFKIPAVAPKLGIDPGHELHRCKGLRHIIIRPDIEPCHLVDLLGLRREHNHRKIVMLPKLHRHRDSVHHRHHDIDDRQMNLLFFQNLQALQAVLGLEDLISLIFHINTHAVQDLFVILDDQNMVSFHFLSPLTLYSQSLPSRYAPPHYKEFSF